MNPKVKTYTLPAALVLGVVFHTWWKSISFLSPYAIFAMLMITFTKVSPKSLRPHRMHWPMLAFQAVLGFAAYFLLRGIDEIVAQGVMICLFMPAAMASATVGGLLGADVTVMTTFILMSNVLMTLLSPVMFSAVGVRELPFLASAWLVFRRVAKLLLGPLLLDWLLEWLLPSVHGYIRRHQDWSFYVWAFTLMLLMGTTTDFFLEQERGNYTLLLVLALSSLAICVLQFLTGHRIGVRNGDAVAGTQSLGQKNTALAIWLSLQFLNPVASIAPACYVVWQNIINSWQLARKR